nr:hypothetical protein BaRGS_032677 [Batillaria attramentaria]
MGRLLYSNSRQFLMASDDFLYGVAIVSSVAVGLLFRKVKGEEYVETDEYNENPFWFRLFYMVPMFMIFRTRLYNRLALEMGLEYDFETIHNIDIYGCELAPTTKQGLRSWNMTVQYWLATYVHRRVPPALKAYRVSITMTDNEHGFFDNFNRPH